MKTIRVKDLYDKLRNPGMVIKTTSPNVDKLVYKMGDRYVVLKRNQHGDVKSIAIWKNVPWGFDQTDFASVKKTEDYLDLLAGVRRFIDEFSRKFGDSLVIDECMIFSGFQTSERKCVKSNDGRWIVSRQFSPFAGYVKLSLHPDVDEWSTQEMVHSDYPEDVCEKFEEACRSL